MNLIKLCVGVSSVDQLLEWRAGRRAQGFGRPDGLDAHRTRMMPRLADDIVGKGSLYWVIAGAVRARQRIVGLEPGTDGEGRGFCTILMAPQTILTVPQPRRPFQGWRYLAPSDAPADLAAEGEAPPPAGMAEELAKLGLL